MVYLSRWKWTVLASTKQEIVVREEGVTLRPQLEEISEFLSGEVLSLQFC